MAETVLSAFLTVVFEKLASEALKKIARSKGIDSELRKLKNTLEQIQALLNDASHKEITDGAVKGWLNGLQHLAYEIDDVLDDLATEAMHRELSEEPGTSTSMVRKLIPSCCTSFSLSTRMHAKLDKIANKLQELVEAKNILGLSVITNEKPKIERYEASLVDASGVVGREDDKKKLLQKLFGDKDESGSQNFSIVPIVGMGGVGKTTLAKLLYDEKEVKDHFELRAWVCVSDEFSIPNISKVIYQSVTGEKKEFEDLNLLQEALKEKLRNKLFLIVLDDVWSESYGDWDKLVGPFLVGAPGSRIIMTTRKEQLLRKLGFSHQDPLNCLSQDDALSLFAEHALGVDNFDSHPTLKPYGEGFVRKCDGLPLALITLGRLLRTKTNEEEWKDLLDSEIWSLGKRDEIVPALRLSYNDLSASLKQLFAYCSLFPKNYVFDKEELILLWMAEGFLHHSNTSKSMQRLGLEYFEELLSRSFFQHAPHDKSVFVMHDLMNDLATSVAGDFFSRLDICHLPENVCNLYNLQTLIVSGCQQLIKLPKSFSKLKNLQYLDMRDTQSLNKLPLGIGELKSLQTLSNIRGRSSLAISELKNLPNLQGKVRIAGLGNVQNEEARDANLSEKRFSELELDWGDENNVFRTETHEKEVLNELKPQNGTLEKLQIVSYRGIEFPDWVVDPSFHRLTKVSIFGCEECTSLPRLGQLSSLKDLSIGRMSKVKAVGLELLGTDNAFPLLKILWFDRMSGWEEWSTNSGALPCLQELHIKDCPNLVRVSFEPLPSLRVLGLKKCDHGLLKSLVDVASSITKLEIDDISGLTDELWRGVIEYLGAAEEVSMENCNEIRYLWKSEAETGKVLVKLRKLEVSECDNMVRLGEKEEDMSGSSLTSFRSLKVWDCKSFEHCSCPGSIENLDIQSCDSITSVSFPTGGKKLKDLLISNCKKLLEEKLRGREKTRVLMNSEMQMLESVLIDNWPNLKSINLLGNYIYLKHLAILDCPSMESFPDHELPNLVLLEYFIIKKCTSMDASFPRGLWPPKLYLLELEGLKKPISEWGPQNFPTSLSILKLCGGPYDDVRNFTQLSHLFPSSLTLLSIDGFEKLESVSRGLQHLTSLQHLFIYNCPKMTDLPETLLPSLLVMRIEGCPKLKEKISRGGSYWPQISLIPCFNTNEYITSLM